MARLHGVVGLLFVGACTLIGDTGDKRYLPADASSSGDAPCGGVCPGTTTQCAFPACVDGGCDIVFVKAGDPCTEDGGQFCDGAGSCVECILSEDCPDDVCIDNVCFAGVCNDSIQDGLESDVDCGGGDCPDCDLGQTCVEDADCKSNICDLQQCIACRAERDCADPTKYCGPDGNCLDKKPEGAPCEESIECQRGLECDSEDLECVDGG